MSKDNITSCYVNISAEELNFQLGQRVTEIFHFYYGYLSIPFAGIGLLMSILFIIAVIKAVKQHRVSRKCYVLIINRTIGDALSCIMANILTIYVITKDVPNKDMIHIFENFFIASFWSGMISYVSLSVLKLYAVASPLQYRNNVTMKKCIYLVVASWVIFFIVLSYALGATALTRIPFLQHWSQCKVETCLRMMYRIRNLFVIGIYCFTIICFILTVIYVHRAKRFIQTFRRKQEPQQRTIRLRFPLWKLALNVATFAIFNLPYVGIIITFIILAGNDKCFSLRNYPTMMQTFGIIRLGLLARIIVDPIISFFTDFQIRRSVLTLFGIHSKAMQSRSTKRVMLNEASEENSSSDFEIKNASSSKSIGKEPSTQKTDISLQ